MMKRLFATFVVLAAGARLASAAIPDTYSPSGTNSDTDHPPSAVTTPPAATPTAPKPASTKPKSTRATATTQTLAQMQSSLDELTKSNHDLLDLLKQQQSVLEDIQYDRRLQSRQIDNLESRLEEALTEKQQLQDKVDKLELQASQHTAVVTPTVAAQPYKEPDVQTTPQSGTTRGKPFNPPDPATSPAPNNPPTAPTIETVHSPDSTAPQGNAPPPSTYLPPEGADNAANQGGASWHRLFTLKGSDNQQSDVFTVHGKLWRVLWHNQDKPGKLFANTSALFINAFPRDDTIPQKVCSKLGTGGDSVEMQGPGNYYVKVEASGGSWEMAVEDFH